ncbi:MAG: substrate-binding domain-containing protein, partial [Polyangiales bacterium]
MKPKLAIVIGFLIAVGVILFVAVGRGGKGSDKDPAKPDGSGTAVKPRPADVVEISLEYSTEKREWLEAALAQFHAANPSIKVNLIGKGSLEAAGAILDGADKPTLWSPADSLVANLLASDWQTKTSTELFPITGETGPQPLLLTPLVFAVWEDRAKVLLDASGGTLSWRTIHKAVTSPKGWPAIGGKASWGFVKLGHTDPTKSNSGLQALLSMTYEFYDKTSGLQVGDLLKPAYQD